MAELKPCPFCGGRAEMQEDDGCVGHGENDTLYYVECCTCGGRTQGFGRLNADSIGGRKTLAVLFWEMRAEDGK